MAHVTLVIGGARSGKSSYASRLAREVCDNPVYVATARIFDGDAEFEHRVKLHKEDRGEEWVNIEEQKYVSKHAEAFSGKAVVVDCLTLWLTNFFIDAQSDGEAALAAAKEEFDRLAAQWDATFFMVTNEIGSGVHAETPMGRAFVDAQGWLNQHVGRCAASVVLMVAGQPVHVKTSPGIPPLRRGPGQGPAGAGAADAERRCLVDTVLSGRGIAMDECGYFMIKTVDSEILALFFSSKTNDEGEVVDPVTGKVIACSEKGRTPARTYRGRSAKELQVRIFEQLEVPQISPAHACYIGRELQKAEAALAAGEAYVQD